MVLHINTHSSPSPTVSNTTIALDGESFVLVPRKRMKLERARRTPLADKTPSFNTVCPGSLGSPSVPIFIDVPNRMALLCSILALLVNQIYRFQFIKRVRMSQVAIPSRAGGTLLPDYPHSNPFRLCQNPRLCELLSWISPSTLPLLYPNHMRRQRHRPFLLPLYNGDSAQACHRISQKLTDPLFRKSTMSHFLSRPFSTRIARTCHGHLPSDAESSSLLCPSLAFLSCRTVILVPSHAAAQELLSLRRLLNQFGVYTQHRKVGHSFDRPYQKVSIAL
jgi:hypothetical protein